MVEKKTKAEKKDKPAESSDKKENIAALLIFVLLLAIGIGILTSWFGLVKNDEEHARFNVPVGDDPYKGNPDATVRIVAFSDYECSYCQRAEQTMQSILSKYPDKILYIFRDYPLTSIHPHAYNAALAAECAREQDQYWEYHELLYEQTEQLEPRYLKEYALMLGLDSDEFSQCLDNKKYAYEIEEDINTAKQLRVTGTPTFFINGIKVIGAKSEQEFTKIINSEIKRLE